MISFPSIPATAWRKSSYSGDNGGDCLEVADGFVAWRKSSYSGPNGGDCLEVADGVTGVVPVRDSKAPDAPGLAVPAAAWSSFVGAVTGERLARD